MKAAVPSSVPGIAALVCAAVTLVACGPQTRGSTPPIRVFSGIAAATTAAHSYRFDAHISLADGSAQAAVLDTTAIYDEATRRGQFTTNEPGGVCEQINDGNVAFFRGQCMGARDAGVDKPWVEVATADAPLTVSQSVFGNVLGQLGRGVSDVRVIGHEDVRGVSTTHYRALWDQTPPGYTTPSTPTLLDVWIDGQGRLRRATMTVTTRSAQPMVSVFTNASFDLYDYGVAVTVVDPPPDQVDNEVTP